jgi:hypothetical protein
MLNTAKEKRERYYDIIIQRKLPMPDNMLEVFDIQNDDSRSPRSPSKSPESPLKSPLKSQFSRNEKIPIKNNEEPNKTESSSSESSSGSSEESMASPRPKMKVPEPFGLNLENVDPAQSSHIRKVNEVIDQKLEVNENFIKNIPEDADVSEANIIKILENYNEDMEMIYLLTCKVSKTLAKTLSKTNKLYNK